MIHLEREANKLCLSHIHTRQDGKTTALRAACCCFVFVAVNILLIYHFEQESRIRQQNIVKTHLYEEH